MKKLIVFSVILVLLTGVAFAEVNFGGYVVGAVTPAAGTTVKGDDEIKVDGFVKARLQASASNDEGTFGAVVRVYADLSSGWHTTNVETDWSDDGQWLNIDGTSSNVKGAAKVNLGRPYAWAWWKPIDQFRLQIGSQPDGDFGVNQIVGWGWHASDAEDVVAFNGYGFTRSAAFYAGFDQAGAVITITPIDALSINVGIPLMTFTNPEYNWAKEVYPKTNAQIAYDIAGVGVAAVTYAGGVGHIDKADRPHSYDDEVNDPSSIFASFYVTALEDMGLNLNIGFKYTMGYTKENKDEVQDPMAIGLGAAFASGDLGVKLRTAVTLAGSKKTGGVSADDPMKLGVDIMPYYDLGIMKAFFNAGIEYNAAPKGGDAVIGWYINPFVTKSAGGGTFFAGAQIFSNMGGVEDDKIGWAIPIGMVISF